MPMPLSTQFAYLFILALPVACVAWTVTHEEVRLFRTGDLLMDGRLGGLEGRIE